MSAAVSAPITLPNSLTLTCLADDSPRELLLVLLVLKAAEKNDFTVVVGPSDSAGQIVVSKREMEEEINRTQEAFPSDYAGLNALAGEIHVSPMDRKSIEAALEAYDLFHPHLSYPPDYRTNLEQAWKTLYQLAPKILSVKLDGKPPANVRVLAETITCA